MSAADPGCALYGEDEMRWTAGPRGWPSILGRSICRTRWLYLPGRVPEREAQHGVQREFLNECLATTVQVEIFASVTISAKIAFRLILQSWGKSPNCLAGGIDPQTKQDPDQKCWASSYNSDHDGNVAQIRYWLWERAWVPLAQTATRALESRFGSNPFND